MDLENIVGHALFPSVDGVWRSPALLWQENEALKKVISLQDEEITALTNLVELSNVENLLAENADLKRLLGLRGELAALEQQIENRED